MPLNARLVGLVATGALPVASRGEGPISTALTSTPSTTGSGFLTGVPDDGRVIVGQGAGPLGFQGYVVVLPEL